MFSVEGGDESTAADRAAVDVLGGAYDAFAVRIKNSDCAVFSRKVEVFGY